jgi:hypothetical protein
MVRYVSRKGMASTAKALSVPSSDALEAGAAAAELAERLTITKQGERFRLELWGDRAGNAIGVVARLELQRILRMLELQVEKARWTSSVGPIVEAAVPKPVHH